MLAYAGFNAPDMQLVHMLQPHIESLGEGHDDWWQ